jgi:hypothetical protein
MSEKVIDKTKVPSGLSATAWSAVSLLTLRARLEHGARGRRCARWRLDIEVALEVVKSVAQRAA